MDRRLALIELLDGDGQVRQSAPVLRWPATVGRSLDCDLVLDDPHVAAVHAVLQDDGASLRLSVGDSLNGVQWGACRLAAGEQVLLAPGSRWLIGPLVLRVRLAREALAPERPFEHPETGWRGGLALLALLLGFALWVAGDNWLARAPAAGWDAHALPLLAALAAMGVWAAGWGLGSKLFRRHFEFAPHLRLALGVVLAAMACDLVLAVAAYALSQPWLSHIRGWVQGGFGVGLVAAHIERVLPQRRRGVGVALVAMLVAGIAIQVGINLRQDRWARDLYLWTLLGPALRLADAAPPQALVDDVRGLQAGLDRRAREDDGAEDEGDEAEQD
jgi:hypothetical protein